MSQLIRGSALIALAAAALAISYDAASQTAAPGAPAPAAPNTARSTDPAKPLGFFVTSEGTGKGADLGGLAGADAHCQKLAASVGAGARTWRAYLSTQAADGHAAPRRSATSTAAAGATPHGIRPMPAADAARAPCRQAAARVCCTASLPTSREAGPARASAGAGF